MDYTNIPKELIYKDRKTLDDFARNNMSIKCISENIRELYSHGDGDINVITLSCLNTAYHVCTLAVMDDDNNNNETSWSGIREITIRSVQYNQEKYQLIILSIVAILLERKDFRERPNVQRLINNIHTFMNEKHYLGLHDIYNTLLKNINDFPLPTDIFEPISIFQALETANDSTIIRGIKYIEECIIRIHDPASQKYALDLALTKFEIPCYFGEDFNVKSRLEYLRNNPNFIPQKTSQNYERIAKLELENRQMKNRYEERIENLQKENKLLIKEQEKIIDEKVKAVIEKYNETNSCSEKEINYPKEISDLRAKIDRLEIDLEGKTKEDKNIPAHQAAIFVTTICRELKQMPSQRESLAPILQYLWGFRKSTSKKALRRAFTQDEANTISINFKSVAPKIARLIEELPQNIEKENELRLKNLKKKKS